MTTNNYTIAVLENGHSVSINIANFFGFDEKQIAKLKKVGCYFVSEGFNSGWFFDASNVEEYKATCKALRGFQMGYMLDRNFGQGNLNK